jgi:hypothetical protein
VNVIYTFSTPYLLNIVQHWVNGDYHNYGLVLRSGTETYSVDRSIFYSSKDTDQTKRPRLILTYTKK